MVKQIHSQVFDDKEFEDLSRLKELKGWTWKELILSTIKKGDDNNEIKRD